MKTHENPEHSVPRDTAAGRSVRPCCFPLLQRGRGGFTLVELLVVIAIIGVLAGMLLPSLARVRETALCTKDLSNLRQLTHAWQMYANEYEGATFPMREGHYPDSWPMLLAPYLSHSWDVMLPFRGQDPLGVRDVPSDVIKRFMQDKTVPGKYTTGIIGICVFPAYGYNYKGWNPRYDARTGKRIPPRRRRPVNINTCRAPTEVVVFGTTIGMGKGKYKHYGWYKLEPYRELKRPKPGRVNWRGPSPLVQNSYGGLSPCWRNGTATNVSFADGHVETCNPADLADVRYWDPQP